MNPRSLGNFLKSKFGLFVVFVVVLFSGLWIYGRHQAGEREAAKLAAQDTKKITLGQVRVPLDKGLENGVPHQVRSPSESPNEEDIGGGEIVPFRPPPAVAPAPTESVSAKAGATQKAEPKPRKVRYASLLATYTATPGRSRTVCVKVSARCSSCTRNAP